MTATLDAMKAAQTYTIDKMHSEVAFQVRHLLTKVRGRFTEFAGTVLLDQEHPEQSSASLTIEASSVDTGTPDRDTHLRSDDFFAVGYPLNAHVHQLAGRQDGRRHLRRGRNIDDSRRRQGDHAAGHVPRDGEGSLGNVRAGFETSITLNRKDFGLTWNAALETGGFLVGDEVRINLSIQAIAQ